MNRRILNLAKTQGITALVTTKGTTLSTDMLAALRKMGIRTLNWFPENIHHTTYTNWLAKHYQDYDYFLSFDPAVEQFYPSTEKTKVAYLPFGIAPSAFQATLRSEDQERYTCDVCFAGAPYPERVELLQGIAQMGVSLKIFGWEGWLKTPLAPFYHGALTTEELAKLYRTARISLNTNLWPVNSGANVRTFEIPASRGFQICDAQDDLPNLFIPGKEIVVFSDFADLKEKITYYLQHTQERDAIAEAGFQRVIRDHTFDQRAAHILGLIQNQ